MKKTWETKWETIPGDCEQTVGYPSLECAMNGIRERVRDTDLREFSAAIQNRRNRKFQRESAHFLDRVLTDPRYGGGVTHDTEGSH